MAELAIKIGNGDRFLPPLDGDVSAAFSVRYIRYMHAGRLCEAQHRVSVNGRVRSVPLRRDPGTGLIPDTSIDRQFAELVYSTRYERTSKTTVDRVDIATGERTEVREPLYEIQVKGFRTEQVFGFSRLQAVRDYLAVVGATDYTVAIEGKNKDVVVRDAPKSLAGGIVPFPGDIVPCSIAVIGKHCFVEEYLKRAKWFGKQRLFGEPGREVWYGGRKKHGDESVMGAVWAMIERETPHREEGECPGCGEWHTRTCLSRERDAQLITLAIDPQLRKRMIARGDSEPLQVKYFGADRWYHVGDEGQVVEAILGGTEARHFLFLTTDAFDDSAADSLKAPLRYTEEVRITEATETEAATANNDGTYRLTLDKAPAHIRQVETVTIDGTDYSTSRVSATACDVVAKAAPKTGRATVTGIVARHQSRVDWRKLPGLTAKQRDAIADRTVRVDMRASATFNRADIVAVKEVA